MDETRRFLNDSQDYVANVMPRRDATIVDKQGSDADGSICTSPSILRPVLKAASKQALGNNKIDIVRDAEAYAASVSEQLGAVLRTPQSSGMRRKKEKTTLYA